MIRLQKQLILGDGRVLRFRLAPTSNLSPLPHSSLIMSLGSLAPYEGTLQSASSLQDAQITGPQLRA